MDRYQQRYGDHRHFEAAEGASSSATASAPPPLSQRAAASRRSIIVDREMATFQSNGEAALVSSTNVGGGSGLKSIHGIGGSSFAAAAGSGGGNAQFSSAVFSTSNNDYAYLGSPDRRSLEWLRCWDVWLLRRAAAAERHPLMSRTIRPALDAVGSLLGRVWAVLCAVGGLYAGALSGSQHCLVVFFLSSAIILHYISWCMGSSGYAAFTVPAFHHGWNLKRKARACDKAALYNIFAAIFSAVVPRVLAALGQLVRTARRDGASATARLVVSGGGSSAGGGERKRSGSGNAGSIYSNTNGSGNANARGSGGADDDVYFSSGSLRRGDSSAIVDDGQASTTIMSRRSTSANSSGGGGGGARMVMSNSGGLGPIGGSSVNSNGSGLPLPPQHFQLSRERAGAAINASFHSANGSPPPPPSTTIISAASSPQLQGGAETAGLGGSTLSSRGSPALTRAGSRSGGGAGGGFVGHGRMPSSNGVSPLPPAPRYPMPPEGFLLKQA